MEVSELKEQLHDLFEKNKFKQIFQLLKEELDIESEKMPKFRMLKRRYNEYYDEKMSNTIDRSKAKVEISQIGISLDDFIDSIEQSDLGIKSVSSHQEIPNQLLIFTKEADIEIVSDFFQQLNFVNVEVKNHKTEEYDVDDYDLVIFDNRDLPVCFNKAIFDKLENNAKVLIENRIEKMEAIIKTSSKFLIHFGDILFWISANRDRVQAANSKFSLYARTKEVIDFINTYRV